RRRRFRSMLGGGTRVARSQPVFEDVFRKNGVILPKLKSEVPGTDGPLRRLLRAQEDDRGEVDNGTRDAMWISLFTLACGAAVCLSVAAILMERGGQRPLRRW